MSAGIFEQVLKELHEESGEISASGLVSGDGIMVACHLPDGVNENKLASMSAAMLSVGERMAKDLLAGVVDRIMIQSGVGYIIVSAVSPDLLLTLITKPNAKLAMLFHDTKELAKKLQFLQYGVE